MRPTAEAVLADPAVSYWLKDAIRTLQRRDPCDAARDAALLAEVIAGPEQIADSACDDDQWLAWLVSTGHGGGVRLHGEGPASRRVELYWSHEAPFATVHVYAPTLGAAIERARRHLAERFEGHSEGCFECRGEGERAYGDRPQLCSTCGGNGSVPMRRVEVIGN